MITEARWFTASIMTLMIFILIAVTTLVYYFFGGLYADDLVTLILVELAVIYVVTFIMWGRSWNEV